jgi:hypothetical protein
VLLAQSLLLESMMVLANRSTNEGGNMRNRAAHWGFLTTLPLLILIGCGGVKTNDNASNLGPSAATGSPGSSTTTGNPGSGTTTGNPSSSTTTDPNSAPPPNCFTAFDAGGGASALKLGPGNVVFPEPRLHMGPLMNYADQIVFDTPTWEMNANFAPAVAAADDPSLMLPVALSSVARNVGELHITRAECKGVSAVGRTLRVSVWWKLGGAIVRTPTEGVALGSTNASFPDAINAAVVGAADNARPLNSLNPLVLKHTFDETDGQDAGEVFLRLWLLETFEFPSTFYVNRVVWDE